MASQDYAVIVARVRAGSTGKLASNAQGWEALLRHRDSADMGRRSPAPLRGKPKSRSGDRRPEIFRLLQLEQAVNFNGATGGEIDVAVDDDGDDEAGGGCGAVAGAVLFR
jgi:hypothetical protein